MYLSKLQGKNVFYVNCDERYNTYDNYLFIDWEIDDLVLASFWMILLVGGLFQKGSINIIVSFYKNILYVYYKRFF